MKKIPSALLLAGIIFILVLKTFIRPQWLTAPDETKFLMGIFPNLFGSFLLLYGVTIFKEPMPVLYNNYLLRLYAVLCFMALVTNEYLQLIPVFGRTFDYFDIAASAIGLSAGYFIAVASVSTVNSVQRNTQIA